MTRTSRLLAPVVATAAAALATTAVVAPAAPAAGATDSRATLLEYATDTWASMDAMVDPGTGLVSDNVGGDLSGGDRAAYTSPTNIGAYMWSAIAARDIGIISTAEAREKIAKTLTGVAVLEKHESSGMFYNWYSPTDGHKLTVWPVDDGVVQPFLSSVDNGWLATALIMVAKEIPALSDEAHAILDPMDFGYYYNPAENQIRGGFWVEDPNPDNPVEVPANYGDPDSGEVLWYTGHHYGAFNTEPRMASYLGIASGQIPQKHYFGTWRTFPKQGCDWSWTEQRAIGNYDTYLGVKVFEGAYRYAGKRFVPTWGGSMFEALMVPLFVPEEKWGTKSWALTHPTYVQAQIHHGMQEAGYGYWGFSPSNNPAGGYREYGVDPIGMEPNGYASDQERTYVDYGYGECRPAQPEPEGYGQGVVTPHASFLAYRYAPQAALDNLANLREDFGAYGPGGFYDAVNVETGEMSKRYLSLDQGMVMAALGNALAGNDMRAAFSSGPMADKVKPLMQMEEFSGITRGDR